jgi:hypothetical protein
MIQRVTLITIINFHLYHNTMWWKFKRNKVKLICGLQSDVCSDISFAGREKKSINNGVKENSKNHACKISDLSAEHLHTRVLFECFFFINIFIFVSSKFICGAPTGTVVSLCVFIFHVVSFSYRRRSTAYLVTSYRNFSVRFLAPFWVKNIVTKWVEFAALGSYWTWNCGRMTGR